MRLALAPNISIDYSLFQKPAIPPQILSCTQKIQQIALAFFNFFTYLFIAFGKAVYSTFSYAGVAFRRIVLGYYEDTLYHPGSLSLMVFKVIFWIASLGWCLITTTCRLIYEHFQDKGHHGRLLQAHAYRGIDVSHIQPQPISIDPVSPDIQVKDLLKHLKTLNLEKPKQPDYIPPSHIKGYTCNNLGRLENRSQQIQALDLTQPSSKKKQTSTDYLDLAKRYNFVVALRNHLKDGLENFIHYINERTALLGAPPAHDTPRLTQFYEQLKNAVRYSLLKAPHIAPLILRLGTAGHYSASYCMTQAMDLYTTYRAPPSFKQTLLELLAQKRKEIVLAQMHFHFPDDLEQQNAYLASMGNLLALPGSDQMIEHLSPSLDRSKYLNLFFAQYTCNVIFETIRARMNDLYHGPSFKKQLKEWMSTELKSEEKAETLITKDPSPELLEWILVSHGILTPQAAP